MHYSSHPPRTFHNRITKRLGVLVGAALLVALGLPGVAQAQAPATPTITYGATNDIVVTWIDTTSVFGSGGSGTDADDTKADSFLVEFSLDNEAIPSMVTEARMTSGMPMMTASPERNNNHGVWQARVTYYDDDAPAAADATVDMETGDEEVNSVDKKLGTPSGWATYTHGPPVAPEDFVSVGQETTAIRVLSWTSLKAVDTGIMDYQMRWTDGDPSLTSTEWTKWATKTSPASIDKLEVGQQYTFELRAVGTSSNNSADEVGGVVPGAVATLKLPAMPTPTPTLPEIAVLLLAMLLLGSGAYLLRGRQSGGLAHA